MKKKKKSLKNPKQAKLEVKWKGNHFLNIYITVFQWNLMHTAKKPSFSLVMKNLKNIPSKKNNKKERKKTTSTGNKHNVFH